MKVVHITTSVVEQSACTRISDALNEIGVESKILVLQKNGIVKNEFSIKSPISKRISKFINLLESKFIQSYKSKYKPVFSISSYGVNILKNKYVKDADIIHIHWINGGFLSIRQIYKLYKSGKKIVWTIHDSWSFTGGCHVRYGCEKYSNKCGQCLVLQSKNKFDISRIQWLIKKKYYNKMNFVVVAPSNKHAEFAKKSSLLKDKQIYVVNNPLDFNKFRPINKKIARSILNLNSNKKIIAFGALNPISAPYKGFDYLYKAFKIMKEDNEEIVNNIELLIFGANECKQIEDLGYKVKCLGRLNDEVSLVLTYSSSDIYISPSIEESFGQTYLESIACGTPAVGFNNTGAEDIVQNNKNGFLIQYKNYEELKDILLFISKNDFQKKLDFNNESFLNKFSYKKIAKDYLCIYNSLLERN
jgi:glycosyltransferase involved in cell wall biosynthesis